MVCGQSDTEGNLLLLQLVSAVGGCLFLFQHQRMVLAVWASIRHRRAGLAVSRTWGWFLLLSVCQSKYQQSEGASCC